MAGRRSIAAGAGSSARTAATSLARPRREPSRRDPRCGRLSPLVPMLGFDATSSAGSITCSLPRRAQMRCGGLRTIDVRGVQQASPRAPGSAVAPMHDSVETGLAGLVAGLDAQHLARGIRWRVAGCAPPQLGLQRARDGHRSRARCTREQPLAERSRSVTPAHGTPSVISRSAAVGLRAGGDSYRRVSPRCLRSGHEHRLRSPGEERFMSRRAAYHGL